MKYELKLVETVLGPDADLFDYMQDVMRSGFKLDASSSVGGSHFVKRYTHKKTGVTVSLNKVVHPHQPAEISWSSYVKGQMHGGHDLASLKAYIKTL